MLRLDLHVHTNYSNDGENTPLEMLEAACEKGLDGLAVTDHNTTAGALEALDHAEDFDLVVIPGIEVSSTVGHLQVLGVTREIEKGATPREVAEFTWENNGLLVVPHPYHWFRHSAGGPLEDLADAVEVVNSRYLTGYANWRAGRVAKRHGLPVTGGSDAHSKRFVGRAYTIVESEPDIDSIFSAIRSRRSAVRGTATSRTTFIRQLFFSKM